LQLIWLILGLLGALWIFWDTRSQGFSIKSSLRWAIGALLVPAIVVPFYLLQSNLRHQRTTWQRYPQEPKDITSNMVQRCPHCGQFYRHNPDRCPHCQRNLKEE